MSITETKLCAKLIAEYIYKVMEMYQYIRLDCHRLTVAADFT